MAADLGYGAGLERFSAKISNFLVGRRVLVLSVMLVLTAFLGYEAFTQRLDPGFDKSVPLSHPYMKTYTEYKPEFGGSNTITVFVQDRSGDMFNPAFFKVLEQVTQEILVMDGVDARTVTSLFTPNVNYVAVTEEGFTGSRIVPADFEATEEGLEQVRQNLYRSDEIGRTVAKDFSGALVIAELVERDPATGAKLDYQEVAERLERLREKYESQGVDIGIIGFATFIGDIIDGAQGVILFFAITLAVTFVLLVFFAGSWKLAVAAIAVSLAAVAWQLGLVKLLGYGVDPLSILVPFLVLAIGVSHAVQMTNAWRLGILSGMDGPTAAKDSFNKLFIPGATALVSDAVGFAVIMIIDIDIIRELGITASIGVGVMLLTNKFMLPAILSYLSLNERELARAHRASEGADHRFWNLLARSSRPVPAAVIVLLSLGLVAYGASKSNDLIIGDSEAGAPEFWPDSRYNRDIDKIVSNFTVGLDEFVVIAESTQDSACVNYGVMETIDDFVWHMRNVPGVRSVKSLSQVVRERNVGNYEANPKFLGLPRNEQMIAANIYRVEMSQRLFNNDCSVMPVTIYPVDHQAGTLQRIVKAVKAYQDSNSNPDVTFRMAMGNAGIWAATNEAVKDSVLTMDAILFVAIVLCVFLTFFSWRAALCVMLPLLAVSIFANAVMVFLNIGLKVSTLPVLALGVGVGVDYGIYLFARAFVHMRNGEDVETAFSNSYREVGTAVVFTAVTMTLGVALWYFSDLKFQSDMGVLLAYMFFVNMLGAVLLMPAITRFLMSRKMTSGTKSAA
ncbi:MAG TPA: multidrug RND transporter [Gammaproteobacteria bacterium]|uniref:efflux RND transporter permease subunit n=1 Tax=Immundisolibacter sp. TaxID=1934948 RepID=UPI000E8D59DA|nr:multidrug RND transporter [Gammaproteobacteria bacterium]HCZ49043.1 multidrug RND transporter [Gammaproteobacteria bacterium]MCH78481.1 multidrug RND transporter [Gammaproteobacteria bacterium]